MLGLLTLAALSFTSGNALADGFLSPGAEVSVTNLWPTITTVAAGPTGYEPTSSLVYLYGYTFSFTDNMITFTNSWNFPYGTGEWGGFELQFTGIPAISDVVNDPSSQLDPRAITFNGDTIWLEFLDQPRYPGEVSTFDVTFAPATVPEPTSLSLFASGLIGLGLLRRRKRV
jgi:hypothetical protein